MSDARPDEGIEPTRSVSVEDTQSTPEPEPAANPLPDRPLKIIIATLAAALLAALLAIVALVVWD